MKSTSSCGGKKYFVIFIDNYTPFCYVYFLNITDETIDKYKQLKNKVENQLNLKDKNDLK